jgi:hypothetical protein
MIYKLDIYECNSQNFNKGGKVSKRAKTALGSTMTAQPDHIERAKFNLIEHLESYGYTNIHTGYVDNILYLQRDGKEYVAFQSIQMSNWPNAMTVGFSSDLKN